MAKRIFGARLAATVVVLLLALSAARVRAMPGYALSFNATNQYVKATIPALTNNYTFCAWVFLRAGGNFQGTRVGVLSGTNCGNSAEVLITSSTASSSDPQFLELGRCGFFSYPVSSQPVALDQWVHVALTVGANNLVSYFVNGVSAGATNLPGNNLVLGPEIHLADNSLRTFNGLLNDVQIWSRALSQAEIQTNMNRTLAGSESGLVACWPFTEIPGSALVRDATGHGHDGTLVNRPLRLFPAALNLSGPNPLTNECPVAFTEPGAVGYAPPASVVASSLGALALKADGSIQFWGADESFSSAVPASATNLVALAGSPIYNLALKADGSVAGWGRQPPFFPALPVPASATNVVALSCGRYGAVALRADGSVLAWAVQSDGQTNVPAAATNIIAVAAGSLHNLALKGDGSVLAWGDNSSGQTNVPANATNIIAIAAGSIHNLALKADGSVVAWGDNSSGQSSVPPNATNIIAVAAGTSHSLALKADGSLLAWGDDSTSQIDVPPAATNVIAISAGDNQSLAMKADGSILYFGGGFYQTPTNVFDFSPVVSGSVIPTLPGAYILTYSLTNVTAVVPVTRTVVVGDTLPPVLTLSGLNPLAWPLGTPFIDPGNTALDACGGDLTGSIITTGNLNVNVPGIYTLTYTVTDASGNVSSTNRAVWVGVAPSISGLFSAPGLSNPVTGIRGATLYASINPDGFAAAVYFQYGLDTSYLGTSGTISLPSSYSGTNVAVSLSGLAPGVTYHWRAVATNSQGVTASPDQLLTIPSIYAPGDLNGDGMVSQLELEMILSNYWPTSPWLQMTNVAGLGGTNVTFGLTNSTAGAFSVEVSTNLTDWKPLGPAVPRYLFTDTNAPAQPQRYYRLRWP